METMRLHGLHNRVVQRVHDELRRLEANAARARFRDLQLKGDVELDATVLRKVHISSRNPDWVCLVKDWQQKHPGAALPKVFQLHIRCAGALQRDGPVLLAPLPAKLVVPGARPPTESLQDVYSSGLVTKLAPGATQAFSDGNKAWKKVCLEAGLPFEEVVHKHLQFARWFKKRKGAPGASCIAGTQALDRFWGEVKSYLPKQVVARKKAAPVLNSRLWEYTYACAFRHSEPDLWAAVSRLVRSL